MATLRLYNEKLDFTIDHYICDNYSIEKIKKLWKHRYGKMYYKSTVEVIGNAVRICQDNRRIVNVRNGKIYTTKYDAAIDLNLTTTTIYNHLKKRNGLRFEYLVMYEGEDNND